MKLFASFDREFCWSRICDRAISVEEQSPGWKKLMNESGTVDESANTENAMGMREDITSLSSISLFVGEPISRV